MAVEIPVVVDIQAAFKTAAAQVPSAIRPLKDSIEKYSEDLMKWTEKMRTAKVDSPEFIKAAKSIQAISQALEVAEDRLLKFSTNPGSIKRLNGELAALERRWSEMGRGKKFDANGNLSADAQKMYEDYKKIAEEIAKAGKSLSQMHSEEKRLAEEQKRAAERLAEEQRRAAERLAEEQRRAAEAARAHQDALRATATTIQVLEASSAAWRKELNSIDFYKNPALFARAAQNAEYLSRQLSAVAAQVKIIGSNSGSIDQLNARLQEVTRKYNALSESDRVGAQGKALLQEYRDISKEIDKQAKDIGSIISEENRRAEIVAKVAQKRANEENILKTTVNTINVLTKKAEILQRQLNNTVVGTDKFNRLQQELKKVNEQIDKARGGVDRVTTSMQRQSGVLRSLTSMASMYFSVFGLVRFAKQIRDVTGELEYQRIALGRLIQDEKYGNKLFEQIKAAAIESPFRIKDLVTYTKQLAAYRVEQESLYDTTKRLADISAGLGVDMNRLILAYGQVRAASVLRGQELRQFTEAGIPLVELLAEKFSELRDETVSTADVFKLISERAVPFSMIAEIFEDLTDKGGMFYEMQKKQAETLKGRWEKLKDAYDIALQSVGETKTFERYNNAILSTLTFLSRHLTVVPKLIEGVSAAWLIYYAATTKSRIATRRAAMEEIREATAKEAQNLANIKGIKNVDAYTYALIRQRVATNALSRAFWRLWAAIVANPLGAAIAAIGAITAAIFLWNKRTKDINESTIDLNNTMENLAAAEKDYQRVEKLSKTYEHLASKTERSAKENMRLSQTIDNLNDRFPDLKLKVDDDTESIKANTDAIRYNIEERRKQSIEDAKNDLRLAEETLKLQEKERDEKRSEYEDARTRAASTEDLSGTRFASTYENYVKEANKAREAFEKADEEYNNTLRSITRLREKLEPTEDTKAWKEQLRQMQLANNGAQVFDNEAIDGWHRLYDASSDLEKEWIKIKEELDGMRESASKVKPEYMEEWAKDVQNLESKLEQLEFIKLFFGFSWGKKERTKSDTRLSDLKKDISEVTNAYKKFIELRKYMSKESALNEMAVLFPQLKGWEPTLENTLERLRGFMKNYKGPKDKTFLEMQRAVDTEISNLKFDELKRVLNEKLQRVSDEMKRSEAARDFYKNILGLTGDEELAASLSMSVYGESGKDFKDRIQEELYKTLSSIDPSMMGDKADIISQLLGDVTTLDWNDLFAHLDDLPEDVQKVIKRLRDEEQKYNANVAKDYAKLLLKFDEVEQQRVNIESEANEQIRQLREGLQQEIAGIDKNAEIQDKEAAKKEATARVEAVEKGINLEKRLRLSRLEKNYRMFFNTVGLLSDEAARTVVANQKEILYQQFLLDGNLVKYNRELKALNEQLEKYTKNRGLFATYLSEGFEAATSKLGEYADTLRGLSGNLTNKDGKIDVTPESIDFVNKLGLVFGGKMFGVSGRRNVWDQLIKDFGDLPDEIAKKLNEAASEMDSKMQGRSQGVGWAGFWVSLVGGAINSFDEIAQASKNSAGEVKKGWNNVANVLLKIPTLGFSKGDDAWERFTSMNDRAMQGFEKFKSGNLVGALIDVYYSWAEMFQKSTRTIDRQIKEQSDALSDLEYSYKRVENSIQKAFGSDYVTNYTKQIEILQAKQDAYLKQAELERSKDKKKDEEKIKEYENSARDVADQIEDMQSQLSEFFSGTDLTSAAKDFANAWIEAYKEYGNVTDAMKEKFNDMIQEMVENSVAAQVMQNLLRPIFEQIDALAKEGGELSMEDVAQIAKMATDAIPGINEAMTTLMNTLTASGYNVRQKVGQFTGISRNIANASEESINGLAQGVNTQNWYLSYVPGIHANVAAILEILNGGTGAVGTQVPSTVVANNELMMSYLSNLEPIKAAVLQMRDELHSVVSSKYAETNSNVVAIRM